MGDRELRLSDPSREAAYGASAGLRTEGGFLANYAKKIFTGPGEGGIFEVAG